ncbi:uncharacterized protein LOC127871809 [Dreissena polymorpha]|uniref:uncharacterized protein LOC127871809 n=1 Tax=Dreissena polymorpha TaxID=45954 RepID=UPI00226516E6|nr:uncharacterized protein LOC127871809 [Dreissena polymorpha]
MDMNNIWRENKSNALALEIKVHDETDRAIHSSSTHSEPTSQVEFDLSSCLNLKYLVLRESGIHMQDSSSSVSTTLPVYIVLNSANPAQCAYPLPVLPCIEYIGLESITCSSTWLRSLFSTLLTLEQNAVCVLTEVSCQDSMSQSLLSLTHLDTLSIEMDDDSLDLWEALRGLNIKCLSLCVAHGGLNVDYADSMSQSLSSLTHLDTLSIKVVVDSPGLWKALHGLNIKNLSLCVAYGGLNIDYADSMSQSL